MNKKFVKSIFRSGLIKDIKIKKVVVAVSLSLTEEEVRIKDSYEDCIISVSTYLGLNEILIQFRKKDLEVLE